MTHIAFSQERENVYLLANWNDSENIPPTGDAHYNEVWGFVHNGEEYGVIGSTQGTHIFHLPKDNQIYQAAFVPGAFQGNVIHRDFHDYNGYLYAVCDQGNSSLQIIDLSNLPESVDVVYDSNELIMRAHNIFIDTTSALLYACGHRTSSMNYAMSVYSLEEPTDPELLLHFTQVDYVHDAFVRNDTAFLNCATEGLHIYDFSSPQNPLLLGNLEFYPDQGYNHSGWLTEDGLTYVFADETTGMRMKVCDVSNLPNIEVLALFNSGTDEQTIPHNQMIRGNYVYVSHYNDGLQIFDIRDRVNPVRVGFYDTFPEETEFRMKGAWGVYCLLPSERVLVSDRQTGFYVFEFVPPPIIYEPGDVIAFPNPFRDELTIVFDNENELNFEFILYDVLGRPVKYQPAQSKNWFRIDTRDLPSGNYIYQLRGTDNKLIEVGKVIKAG